jgi:hypothetical protein
MTPHGCHVILLRTTSIGRSPRASAANAATILYAIDECDPRTYIPCFELALGEKLANTALHPSRPQGDQRYTMRVHKMAELAVPRVYL